MPTIRVRDWTKVRLDELQERQNHSTHDSVIKTLLKDHELATVLGEKEMAKSRDSFETYEAPKDGSEFAIPGMKVLNELAVPKDNVGFLWCPNCQTEIAHFTFAEPSAFKDFETTCPQCFTNLDQHAIVAIEIDYPLEQKLVEGELATDLKDAVIDYWNRRLKETPEDMLDPEDVQRVNRLVWKFDQYVREFMWEWPDSVPVVGLEAGTKYERTDTDERIEVLERVPKSGSSVDAFRVKRYEDETAEETELLEPEAVCELLRNRKLTLDE